MPIMNDGYHNFMADSFTRNERKTAKQDFSRCCFWVKHQT